MSSEQEALKRERMTRHWLAAERSVRAYIAGAVRSFADREDLLQQVALTVARRFDEYDECRPFLGWVLWLAKSRIVDFYRAQGRQPQHLSEDLLQNFAEVLVHRHDLIPLRQEALEDCLQQLPERSRRLLHLKYQEGHCVDQIAELLQSTPASIRVALFRLREALAGCIQRRMSAGGVE
jgi:RNA polymerase sigma-70 factor (ECF subfamily)